MKKQITKAVITVALLIATITPIFYTAGMQSQMRTEVATILYYEKLEEPVYTEYLIYAETSDGNIYSYTKLTPPKSTEITLTLDKNGTPEVQDDIIRRVRNEG